MTNRQPGFYWLNMCGPHTGTYKIAGHWTGDEWRLLADTNPDEIESVGEMINPPGRETQFRRPGLWWVTTAAHGEWQLGWWTGSGWALMGGDSLADGDIELIGPYVGDSSGEPR